MRLMTIFWGIAFLLDAVARVVMAYTLPVDVVPIASAVLLAVLLTAIVQWSRSYGRRVLRAA
jgi:predicted PurR-regulated permease PerM